MKHDFYFFKESLRRPELLHQQTLYRNIHKGQRGIRKELIIMFIFHLVI